MVDLRLGDCLEVMKSIPDGSVGASKEYEEFVEKFKPKLTTDDCYTPPLVYEAVKDWAIKEYGLEGREIVRPFYPGGDYENYEYPERCVVIDNPPFSILRKIKDHYNANGIDFFLFAPHMTLFSGKDDGTNYIVANCTITYENGAAVNTSFTTNMGDAFIRTAPELTEEVKRADVLSKKTADLPKYRYPDTVISSALLGKLANVDFSLSRCECHFVRSLESQRAKKKTIFGAGFLISELKAAELKAAELKAAELKAAELKAAKEETVWTLSDREKDIIKQLGIQGGTDGARKETEDAEVAKGGTP